MSALYVIHAASRIAIVTQIIVLRENSVVCSTQSSHAHVGCRMMCLKQHGVAAELAQHKYYNGNISSWGESFTVLTVITERDVLFE